MLVGIVNAATGFCTPGIYNGGTFAGYNVEIAMTGDLAAGNTQRHGAGIGHSECDVQLVPDFYMAIIPAGWVHRYIWCYTLP